MSAPVFEISVEVSFSASHQLRDARGELEPLHGHNFRVEAAVAAPELDELGLVMDFLDLEKHLREILAPYDHRHLNDLSPFDRRPPSTENVARFVYGRLEERLGGARFEVRRVRVWEAPAYNACYGKP